MKITHHLNFKVLIHGQYLIAELIQVEYENLLNLPPSLMDVKPSLKKWSEGLRLGKSRFKANHERLHRLENTRLGQIGSKSDIRLTAFVIKVDCGVACPVAVRREPDKKRLQLVILLPDQSM